MRGADFAIGITGSYGGLNRGDEAILTAMIASLREMVPGVALTVFSRDADHTRARHDVERVVPIRELSKNEVVPEVEGLDLLLLGGGGILYDGEACTYLREVELAEGLGVPTMAFSVGAGPLEDRHEGAFVREVLSRMNAVTVRDIGAKRVLEQVGVERPVEVTADPALMLVADEFPAELLGLEGITSGRHLVGMSVREPGKAAPDLDVDGYLALLAQAADFAVHRHAADVVFVPMETGDIRLSHAVIGHMVGAEHAHVLTGDYLPAELLGLVGHFDMVVAMRLHVLIFAALNGVPFLPLPYAAKVADFVQGVGVTPPAPVTRQSAGPLLAAMDEVWDGRMQEQARLRAPVVALQERAHRALAVARWCLQAARQAPTDRG